VRVTLGHVVRANPEGRSFCQFTNEEVSDVERWKLEDSCKSPPEAGRAREQDPFLADTDMTYGMSGSPLFNARGELIGIGSNVLSKTPANYEAGKYAVYDKAIHIDR
jgi:S1-C subfamily serine protease